MRFEFATAGRIVFGPGMISDSGRIAALFGKRALLVTGRNASRSEPLSNSLRVSGVEHTFFTATHEPSISDVETGVAAARDSGCDIVISMGGGSAIDCGKAIAAMLTNPGSLMEYLEVIGAGRPLTKKSAPFMAIPTTAGTGSEVTRNAVLSSPQHKVKVSLRSAGMLPSVALVDPNLTIGLPPALTATTGMDAFTQVLEPFVSCRANPFTDALCREGLRRAAASLRRAFQDGEDPSAREDMALVSILGGLALANAGLGAVHGFAGPLGGMFDAPHGAICATLLPHVMEANIAALQARAASSESLARYDEVARIVAGDPQATASQGVAWVKQLVTDLKIPSLRAYGIVAGDTADIVQKSRHASSMKANPIELTEQELSAIVMNAL